VNIFVQEPIWKSSSDVTAAPVSTLGQTHPFREDYAIGDNDSQDGFPVFSSPEVPHGEFEQAPKRTRQAARKRGTTAMKKNKSAAASSRPSMREQD